MKDPFKPGASPAAKSLALRVWNSPQSIAKILIKLGKENPDDALRIIVYLTLANKRAANRIFEHLGGDQLSASELNRANRMMGRFCNDSEPDAN